MADAISLTSEEITAKTIQEIKDVLYGGITYRNMKTFRTFFVVNAQDSFDSTYPVYVPFNIPGETAEVVSVRVSFWILPYRAYSKAAANNTQQTSSSGGGATLTSGSGGGQTSSSGGGATVTSGDGGGQTSGSYNYGSKTSQATDGYLCYCVYPTEIVSHSGGYLIAEYEGGYAISDEHTHDVSVGSHSHTVYDHTHSVVISNHTHTVAAHSHDMTFGIYEEDNSPSVTLYVSRDGGATYPTIVGTYSTDQTSIEITQYVNTAGSKMLRFEASALGRLSVQVEIKLDMSR